MLLGIKGRAYVERVRGEYWTYKGLNGKWLEKTKKWGASCFLLSINYN
jgi:hypothetical protein